MQSKTRVQAIEYMRGHGHLDIRHFRKAFAYRPNFTPDPKKSYKDEFKRYAASQNLAPRSDAAKRMETLSIRDQIIEHYLPGGLRLKPDQDDEDEQVELDDEETLEMLQGMCRQARKPVYDDIDLSLLELKRRPYVNIIDFIETFRTGGGKSFEN
jgi:hypothetical protein